MLDAKYFLVTIFHLKLFFLTSILTAVTAASENHTQVVTAARVNHTQLSLATVCSRPGTYLVKQPGIGVYVCRPCPTGQYSSLIGASSCEQCGAGKYQTGTGMESSNACTLCEVGTYQTGLGMGSKLDCEFCDVNNFQTGVGQTSGASCKGTFSPKQLTCSLCGLGMLYGLVIVTLNFMILVN